MSDKRDLLIEIGVEEMPPGSLKPLASAFHQSLSQALENGQLNFTDCQWFATPRRLGLLIQQLDTAQADITQQRKGPSVEAAFDESGKPTKATEGFARSCGVTVDQLERLETDKGTWLAFTQQIKGKQSTELLPELIEQALKRLPIAKRMRWGNSDIEFVRPIKWILLLFGQDAIACNIMGVESGTHSYGHRFHHPQPIAIKSVDQYLSTLKDQAFVIADYSERQSMIKQQAKSLADDLHGEAIIDADLLDEVTSLVEWPVAFVGNFDQQFLSLPKEVLIANMQDHQKYFPLKDKDGKLMACFIGIANIDSTDPAQLRNGNERVIQPRLSDAAFFWEKDIKFGLENRVDALKQVIYQKQIGNLHERKNRITEIASYLAKHINADQTKTKRAAELCLCDLLTEMVYEFSELQGTMGKYYATAAGEDQDVADALEAFYLPRYSGDELPSDPIAQCLSLSGKVESLLGIFAIGKIPTGDKDPYGLRRAAIGALRILVEGKLDIDLRALLDHSAEQFDASLKAEQQVQAVFDFMMERLRRYYLDLGINPDVFDAVAAVTPDNLLDFDQRLQAVTAFRQLPEAESLAAANKRINNILKKNGEVVTNKINNTLLDETAEQTLAGLLSEYHTNLAPMLDNNEYQQALSHLAGLKQPVDDFFDNVMVMCEDEATKQNRLALLGNLNQLFLQIADISKLQGK